VDRRTFIAGASSLYGVACVARAQAPHSSGKIGFLHPRTIAPESPTLSALRPVWQRLGYVEGETVLLRSADGDASRLPQLVEELVGLNVGALIAVGAEAVKAASRTTRTTPIVAIDLETDPVRSRLVASFARPGGNVTGLFVDQPSLAGKWIGLLREAAPTIERIALLWDPSTGRDQLEIAESVAHTKGLKTISIELVAAMSFDQAFERLAGRPRTGIVHLTSPGFTVFAGQVAAAAQKFRLPTISHLKTYARAGLLMTYGTVQEVYFARAAVIADRIIKGAKPGNLPIERPDRFELVINLKTARALDLPVPQSLLLRADEVIK
jgi:putative tryptophan/tyrosine transport system substrate-binding protein